MLSICLLIYTAKKIEDLAVNLQGSGFMLSLQPGAPQLAPGWPNLLLPRSLPM